MSAKKRSNKLGRAGRHHDVGKFFKNETRILEVFKKFYLGASRLSWPGAHILQIIDEPSTRSSEPGTRNLFDSTR
jgi:hypothetical protein